jgi:hypothetical protein
MRQERTFARSVSQHWHRNAMLIANQNGGKHTEPFCSGNVLRDRPAWMSCVGPGDVQEILVFALVWIYYNIASINCEA